MLDLQKFLLVHVLACLGRLAHGSDIIHGEKAPENSMQYMASVQDKEGRHVCGGFLITEDFVVSAAHCDGLSLTYVVLGNHNLKNGNRQKIKIEKKIIHENYQHIGLGNDIMLIKLPEKVPQNDRVQTIQLPPAEINLKENQVCQVAGWGKTKTDGGLVDELRVVDVSVIEPRVCEELWPGLPANVICAGGYETTKGFCQGDSGGPLVCHGFAVGVVSFNYDNNCTYPDKPNIYTDISKYRKWIDEGDSGGPLVCDRLAVGVVSFNYNGNCSCPNKPNVYTDISKYLQWIYGIVKSRKYDE